VAGSIVGRSGIHVADKTMEALVKDVSELLHEYDDGEGLSFPMAAHFAVGTK